MYLGFYRAKEKTHGAVFHAGENRGEVKGSKLFIFLSDDKG